MRRTLALIAALATLTGCSNSTVGTPNPEADPSSSLAPVRPKNIDLNGKQRCLLPQTEWAGFFIEKDGKLEEFDQDPKGTECVYNSNVGAFGFLFNTTDGVSTTEPRRSSRRSARRLASWPTSSSSASQRVSPISSAATGPTGRGGPEEEDLEHFTPDYLNGSHDEFRDVDPDGRIAPPVIGE